MAIITLIKASGWKPLLNSRKKTLETEFNKRFTEFSRTRFAAIQEAMDDLEMRLASKTKEGAVELVDGANAMLKKACLTWESELAALDGEAVNVALSQFLNQSA